MGYAILLRTLKIAIAALFITSVAATNGLASAPIVECGNAQNPQGARYALCASTLCTKLSNGQVQCICPVFEGNNWGNSSCAERQSVLANKQVYSTYSPRYSLAPGSMAQLAKYCQNPQGAQSADCFNKLCTLNADGKTANCTCSIMPGDFLMFTHDCSVGQSVCNQYSNKNSNIVINGAPAFVGIPLEYKAITASNRPTADQSYASYFCPNTNQSQTTTGHTKPTK